jgi:4-amino-4-deoxy-L-arabinose transferase-like glycosyltransferase
MKKLILVLIIILAASLRLYKLNSVPPALYWDEASLGYNAYSILKTASDEHGVFLPKTNFAAFGDYKPPLYIYSTVPSVAIFGLSEFAIRFPSAFFGTLTVLLAYLISKKLFENEKISLLVTLFLAISPWHLQISRGAFEANLGLFFSSLGIYLFLKFATDKPSYLILSGLSFVAAMYTFTGQKLFVPFIVTILALQFKNQIFKNFKIVIFSSVLSLIILYPLLIFSTQTIEGRLRFNEVSIFKDLEPSDRSIRYREKDSNSFVSNIIHNRRILYGREYLIHYFDAFNPSFLFIRGDVNPRLSVQEVGELYYIDLGFILAGIYFLFSKKQKYRFLIISWLIISPIGPAVARETPHALRMIHILPTYQMIAAFGAYSLFRVIKYKKIFISISALALLTQFIFYLHMYYVHWPLNYSDQWQYGYKQAVNAIKPLYSEADYIIVDKSLGRPYIYFLLYQNYDPVKYRNTAQIVKDEFFFIDVNSFDKFVFTRGIEELNLSGNLIYVLSGENVPSGANKITEIKDLAANTVFSISKADNQE